jgi:MFS family permease
MSPKLKSRSHAAAKPAPRQLSHREVLPILFGVMLAMFLGALDQTIVATALPTIGRHFGDLGDLAWVVTAYLLTGTAVTPLYGKLSDIHGRRAMMLIAVGIYHAFYLFLTSRGRRVLRDILPKLQDVRDMWDLVRFNLGIRKVKPRLPRFSYIEKAEYWALIWGTVVMAGTGFILWFDNYFINLLTKLGWDVARTIHYYEAILAGLAILVWHFYFVIFNPSVYPINTSFWNGKLTEEQMEDEHGLELEQIRSAAIKKELGEA